jgi:hypothetical protein
VTDQPRQPRREPVNPSDIVGVLCGWAGCGATAEYARNLIPEGWRALVISKYSLLEPAGVMRADIDMMLCPPHVQTLKLLLKPVG